jgi:DNA repair protein RecO (recombination protein O)
MPVFSTPAIMLRRVEYGDYDLILTFFSLERGKITLIAKAAKKSTRRFGGILQLFSMLEITGTASRGKGLPVLQEAALKHPFSEIRTDVQKTAYASYWAELIHDWLPDNERQTELFFLFRHVLGELDSGGSPAEGLSILFQMRLLALSGHPPNLAHCCRCLTSLEAIEHDKLFFDIVRGGITCSSCGSTVTGGLNLSKGTVKQLIWVGSGDLAKASRIRFSSRTIKEALGLMEAFVPYHLGKQPRSLKFLRQIRGSK